MQKKNVAVLCGGYTAERNISLGSGDVVMRNLDTHRYNAYKILVNRDLWIVDPQNVAVDLDDFSCVIENEKIKFDLAFIAIHGSPGEDGKLQGYLDMKNIPYTCCGVIASSVTFNKNYCKTLLQHIDVPMARGMLIQASDDRNRKIADITAQYSLPLFVKPNNNGSSYGISKIKEFGELTTALEQAFQYDTESLVEEGVTGTEVTCGVYRFKGEIVVLPLCEVVTDKHEFFDYTAKYISGESDEVIPARIPEAAQQRIADTSKAIYNYLNCRGVVRIDYILKEETPYFLEVNTVPGLSEASIVPKMAKASGLTISDFFTRLIEESL